MQASLAQLPLQDSCVSPFPGSQPCSDVAFPPAAPASPEIDELGEDDLVDLAIAVEASTSNSQRDPSIDLAAMLAQNDEEHLSFLALLPAHSSAGPASGSGAQVPALGLDLSLEMGMELDIPVGESSGGGAGEGAKRAHEE